MNLRRRPRKHIPKRDPIPLDQPTALNQVWSADFMGDGLYDGTRFRTFNVIDDFNREALAIEVDTSLPGERVIRVLSQLEAERGLPKQIRVDNGPEFTGEAFLSWCRDKGVEVRHIEPGKPNQNAFIERFNGSHRTEVLSSWAFSSLSEVRELTWAWMLEYND